MILENEYLCVEISELGAEVVRMFHKQTGQELLWNADPAFWKRHAPILFPNVGKTFRNTVRIQGTQYPSKQHGFARDSHFRCVKAEKDRAVFLLCSSEESKEVYPFEFELFISYQLEDKKLRVKWTVKNPSNEAIYFTIGGHPAFAFMNTGDKKEDYVLKFPGMTAIKCVGLNLEEGTCDPDQSYTLNLDQEILPLSEDLFDLDTIICDGGQIREAWLCKKADKMPLVGVICDGFPNFGIWSPKQAPFICLEPWAGRCDDTGFDRDISEKPGINEVLPGKEFVKEYYIVVG